MPYVEHQNCQDVCSCRVRADISSLHSSMKAYTYETRYDAQFAMVEMLT